MRTLSGRIGLTLLVFGLVTLLALGGTLWFALRELHRDATTASLTELTVPWAAALRSQFPGGASRPGERSRRPLLQRLREGDLEADADVRMFVESFEDALEQAEASIILVQGSNSLVLDPDEETASRLAEAPVVGPLVRGQVETGTTEIEGLGEVVYATTPIFGGGRDDPPFVMLAAEDSSAERATADLIQALVVAGLVLVVIGIPLAAGLSRSVTRPLRRLSVATGDVAKGKVPEPLPTSGPVEVAEASAAFNAMAAEVGATREAQQQLLADIRHDLRTPLTVIGGFSEALKDGTATGETAVRAADAISDEAGRLERMLDDLDHLTVPGAAGPPLRLETLDGLELAQGTVERFEAKAEQREQELRIADGAEHVRLTADRDAMDRILGNIVENALTHAPAPGGHVRIDVKEMPHGAVISVTDDGPGIPDAALSHVFDRFYRVDPSRTSRGSGLGLAIVSDLAEALGGEAFAENVDGNGARVGVRLPAEPPGPDRPGTA